jgi:hypothetical protein
MAKLGSAGFEVDINSPLLTEAPIIGGVYPETVLLSQLSLPAIPALLTILRIQLLY